MSKRAELSTGEALVGLLEAYGVDTIFGIPGVHNVEMYRALPRSKIRHVLVRHEQGAGFMADGYARATGKPGVCFTITGPGLTNILTPMGQAWSDSSPMLVISSALDIARFSARPWPPARDDRPARRCRHRHHPSHARLHAEGRARRHGPAPSPISPASGRAPPISKIPLDLLKEPAGDGWTARALPGLAAADPRADRRRDRKAQRRQAPAHPPGRRRPGCGAAAVAIAEKLNAPILTTTAGKGVVPRRSSAVPGPSPWPRCRRGFPRVRPMPSSASVPNSPRPISGTPMCCIEQNLIRIDIDPASLARPHTAEIAILGDARAALAAIAPAITARSAKGLPMDDLAGCSAGCRARHARSRCST